MDRATAGSTSLLRTTATSLRAASPDDRGFVRPKARGAFNVVVGHASVERALSILEALLDAATQHGVRFRVDHDTARADTNAHVDGETVALRLLEDSARIKHKLTAEERAYTKTDLIFERIPEWDYIPSGVLAFQVTELGVRDCRRRWGEGRRGPLESKIPGLLDGLRKIAAAKVEARARRAVREQEAREYERREAMRQTREWERKRFRDGVLEQATAWNQSRALTRDLAAAVREAARRGVETDPEFIRWLAWVRAVAASANPLAAPAAPWDRSVPAGDPDGHPADAAAP